MKRRYRAWGNKDLQARLYYARKKNRLRRIAAQSGE